MLSRARSNALTVVLGALLIVGGVSASRAAEAPPPAPPQPRVGGGGWGAAVADPAHGERVYQERCASCHDNPTGRTPTKAAISQSTPNFVMSTLREGVM
jgi:cytochrome c5